MSSSRSSRVERSLLIFLIAGFVVLTVRSAWLGDDAHITLRCVHNWLNGHGLTFNVGERVQAFTHPLWMLCLTGLCALTGEYFFSVIALQIALSLATLGLIVRQLPAWHRCLAVAVLMVSLVFVDYSTSGLENPLAHLLLVAFFVVALREPFDRPLTLAALAGLVVLNRFDHALLVMPMLVARLAPLGWRAATWRLAIGFAPLALWMLAAFFYYGSALPVTAEAKAFDIGVPRSRMIEQGLVYYGDAWRRDPWSLGVFAFGLLVAMLRVRLWPIALSLAAYAGYALWIGGCFMALRFFGAGFVIATLLLTQRLARSPRPLAYAAAILVAVFGVPRLAQRVVAGPEEPVGGGKIAGIEDERAWFYRMLGLFGSDRRVPTPDALAQIVPNAAQYSEERPALAWMLAVGVPGFVGGPRLHIVDPVLLDPLLARLPIRAGDEFVVGHVFRRVPEGYIETIATGENHIVHPGLRRYYELMRRVRRGPLFSRGRLAALWQTFWGAERDGFDAFVAEHYYKPPLVKLRHSELGPVVAQGSPRRFDLGQRCVYEGGLHVAFDEPVHSDTLRVGVDSLDSYVFEFRRGDQSLGTHTIHARGTLLEGIQTHTIPVPPRARGFDSLRCFAIHIGDAIAMLAFVQASDVGVHEASTRKR